MENKEKIKLLQQLVDGAEASIKAARQIISELSGSSGGDRLGQMAKNFNVSSGGRVVEGVFDGEHMIGPDQKKFPIPANYASKSKLIQGDILKLTINNDGSFVFKQIKPVRRKKIVGTLTYANGDYRVLAEGRAYKVLFASITFHKVQPGDSVVIAVPEDNTGQWGAIENIVHPEVKEVIRQEQTLEEIQLGEPLKIEEDDYYEEFSTEDDVDISGIFGENSSNDNQTQLGKDNNTTSIQFEDEKELNFAIDDVAVVNQASVLQNDSNQQNNNYGSVITHSFDKEIKELEI